MKPPEGENKWFYQGWQARLDGKKKSDNKMNYRWGPLYGKGGYHDRRDSWKRGFLACSRALGKIRALERAKKEAEQHDEFVELAREFGL